MYVDSDSKPECSGKQHKDKEWERKQTQQFYTGSFHNTRVVQSPCTSKRFHYNHTWLQIAQGLFQETS